MQLMSSKLPKSLSLPTLAWITPPNPRKLEGMELAKYLRNKGADAVGSETIEDGVKIALELAGDDGVILCFGSLYSIGSIRDTYVATCNK